VVESLDFSASPVFGGNILFKETYPFLKTTCTENQGGGGSL
jgi:hypothetical protein